MTESVRYGCGGDCDGRVIGTPMDSTQAAKLAIEIADANSFAAKVQTCYAWHEGAHVIFATYAGFSVESAQIGCDPRTRMSLPSEEEQTYRASLGEAVNFDNWLMGIMSGHIGEGIARRRFDGPLAPEMQFYFELARGPGLRACDSCKIAMWLTLHYPKVDDAVLMRHWARIFRQAVSLFDSLEFRCQLRRVANALLKHKRLDQADLAKLIDVAALREAASLVTAGGVSHAPPVAEGEGPAPMGQRADVAAALSRPPPASRATDFESGGGVIEGAAVASSP